jgi:hypothetical protein
MSRLPKRPKPKPKPDDGKYTQEERDRWLYKTADEMREINDAVEQRLKGLGIRQKIQPDDAEVTISRKFPIINRFHGE